jgi:hypothetical protein
MPALNLFGARSLVVSAALLAMSAAAAVAGPPFWGATYAYTFGADDPATISGGLPVHVAAKLDGRLSCMGLVDAQLDDPPPYPLVTDSLRAARVNVVIEPSSCPEPGKDQWLNFVVPHPIQADILNLVYLSTSGQVLGNEKVVISQGTGGHISD